MKCTILNNIVHHIGHTGIAFGCVDGGEVASIVTGNFCYRNIGGGDHGIARNLLFAGCP